MAADASSVSSVPQRFPERAKCLVPRSPSTPLLLVALAAFHDTKFQAEVYSTSSISKEPQARRAGDLRPVGSLWAVKVEPTSSVATASPKCACCCGGGLGFLSTQTPPPGAAVRVRDDPTEFKATVKPNTAVHGPARLQPTSIP